MNRKEQIQKIKQEHPNWGYGKISQQVGCSKNTIRYHLDPKEKEAVRKRMIKWRNSAHPLYRKILGFCCDYSKNYRKILNRNPIFKLEDFLSKIGENPICYLTGKPIDILELKGYSLDHKIPLSKGGTSTIENCGLSTTQANRSKTDMTPEEFFDFCQKVLEHQGYKVTKPNGPNGETRTHDSSLPKRVP